MKLKNVLIVVKDIEKLGVSIMICSVLRLSSTTTEI